MVEKTVKAKVDTNDLGLEEKHEEVWQAINPPTGDEKPQKYQSGSYLNEEIDLRAKIRSAAVTGGKVDLEDHHPLTVAEVAPHLLDDQKPGTSHVEAQGDIDTRVEFAVDTAKLATEAASSNKKDDGGVLDPRSLNPGEVPESNDENIANDPLRGGTGSAREPKQRAKPKQSPTRKSSPAKKASSGTSTGTGVSASTTTSASAKASKGTKNG